MFTVSLHSLHSAVCDFFFFGETSGADVSVDSAVLLLVLPVP